MNQYKKLITALIFCFSSLYAWDALADFPGPERLDPSIVNLDEKIYVIGGDSNIHNGRKKSTSIKFISYVVGRKKSLFCSSR